MFRFATASLVLAIAHVHAAPTALVLGPTKFDSAHVVGTPITLSARATVDSGKSVSRVEFYAGGTLVGTDTTATNRDGYLVYSVDWTPGAAGTNVEIKARTLDNSSPQLSAYSAPHYLDLVASSNGAPWQSDLVKYDAAGRLTYATTINSSRVPDYSYAGYEGGRPLPTVGSGSGYDIPILTTLSPDGDSTDDTSRIQTALNSAASATLLGNGYRGAVRLAAGEYEVNGTLLVRSGVVLTGVGSGSSPASNTVLLRTTPASPGNTAPLVKIISASYVAGTHNDRYTTAVSGTSSDITTNFVQVGARSFDVANGALYAVGDTVIVYHPATSAWLAAVNYGDIPSTSPSEYWDLADAYYLDIRYHRKITAISGNTLTIDAPVFNNLDRTLSQSRVFKYAYASAATGGTTDHAGVQSLRIEILANHTCTPETLSHQTPTSPGACNEQHAEDAVQFVKADNCWARNVVARGFVKAGFQLGNLCTRTTIESCEALNPQSVITGERRYNFHTYYAQLVLFENCRATYPRHGFLSGEALDSGIVALDCLVEYPYYAVEGHSFWSHGMLFDNLEITGNSVAPAYVGLGLFNRGESGSGHGWSAAHSTAWRSYTHGTQTLVQQPPTAQNYAIGCFYDLGTVDGKVWGDNKNGLPWGCIIRPKGLGTGQSNDGPVEPRSLYLAQWADRNGYVVTEGFEDGNRSGQRPAVSLDWFASAITSTLTVANQEMTLATGGTAGRHAVAHFPTQTLAVGETMTLYLEFTVQTPRDIAHGLRFGLFNKNGNAAFTADATNPTNLTYTGYIAVTNLLPSAANPTAFRERGSTTPAGLITATGAYGASFGGAGLATDDFVQGHRYGATFTVKRTGTSSATLSVAYTDLQSGLPFYSAGPVADPDSTIVTSFDTVAVALYAASGVAAADAITIEYLAVGRK